MRPRERRGPLAAAMLGALGIAGVTAALTGGVLYAEHTEAAPGLPSPAAGTPFVYDPAAYRHALEADIGHELTAASFARIEDVAGMACGWDGDEFADWVALNADDGSLGKVHLDVSYRCPDRRDDITSALERIDHARRSCVMPAGADPRILASVEGKPAQSALTCLFLNDTGDL
ncbi:hypothetical protein MB27_07010 [Actinoplanes utahensis]|uniref:Uncharacterized protein n=1 Tax=Actinoplanes utahensis TaxID=1869 RepID=A0A0A6XDM1_ACTUT|nr:hypothetical protein MB27_07010 [Actinoplanes utahensis]